MPFENHLISILQGNTDHSFYHKNIFMFKKMIVKLLFLRCVLKRVVQLMKLKIF